MSRLHEAWDRAAAREKEDRAFFSQSGIQPDEVERELEATDSVLGEPEAVLHFLADAMQRFGGSLRPSRKVGVHTLVPGALEAKLKEQTGLDFPLEITLDARLAPEDGRRRSGWPSSGQMLRVSLAGRWLRGRLV